MGGYIGVVSPKIALKAGLLLISARIDLHWTTATIAPSSPVTAVSPEFRELLRLADDASDEQDITKNRELGIDHSLFRVRHVRLQPTDPDQKISIGYDVLNRAVIVLDFARSRLRVWEPVSFSHATKHMTPVAVTPPTTDTCLALKGKDVSGNSVSIALIGNLTSSANERPQDTVSIQGIPIPAVKTDPMRNPCRGSAYLLSWRSFEGRRIVLDLAHDRIWLPAA